MNKCSHVIDSFDDTHYELIWMLQIIYILDMNLEEKKIKDS